jgi:hypothetical protein
MNDGLGAVRLLVAEARKRYIEQVLAEKCDLEPVPLRLQPQAVHRSFREKADVCQTLNLQLMAVEMCTVPDSMLEEPSPKLRAVALWLAVLGAACLMEQSRFADMSLRERLLQGLGYRIVLESFRAYHPPEQLTAVEPHIRPVQYGACSRVLFSIFPVEMPDRLDLVSE